MNTERHLIRVSGLEVQIDRKAIKNLHLGVYPPHGRVRVAAPLVVSIDAVRLAVIDKLGWIKRQQAKFEEQARQSEREMASGESHYYLGRRYRLQVVEEIGAARVVLRPGSILALHVPPASDAGERERLLQRWYRDRLRELIPPQLIRWQGILGVNVADWRIKRMKTRWGSCSVEARRIWLNLELVKKPAPCLEYLIVHELTHFIERHHNDRFIAILDQHLPDWRQRRELLNSAPLAHDTWEY